MDQNLFQKYENCSIHLINNEIDFLEERLHQLNLIKAQKEQPIKEQINIPPEEPITKKAKRQIPCKQGISCEHLPTQKCHYYHTPEEIKICVICTNYLENNCPFGDDCKFAHIN